MIYEANENALLRSTIFNETMIKEFSTLKSAQNDRYELVIETCEKNNISIIPLYSDLYPLQLKQIPNPPKTLFLRGNMNLLLEPKVAIVGSRDSNESAIKWSYEIASDLSRSGIVIVSGGAKGIDIAAHKATIDNNGRTICVFGTGLLNYYPEEHKDIFEKICENGLLISEHLPTFTGSRFALLNRNRITSGISQMLIQATSEANRGSETQMKIALQQKIPIVVPRTDLGFSPFEGIILAKESNKLIEASTSKEIHDILNNILKENPKQNTLLKF